MSSEPDYRGFAWALFENGIDSWDGGDLQDLAVVYGVLEKRQMTTPCGPVCACAEVCEDGEQVECYRWTEFREGDSHD